MTTKKLQFIACIAAIAAICLNAPTLIAQSPDIPPLPGPTILSPPPAENGPSATIALAGKAQFKAKSRKGRFPLAGIGRLEAADIQLQFPGGWANATIIIEALDGGRVLGTPRSNVIAADGTASFRFQVGDKPGLYRILLICAGNSSTLKFWVADPENPNANPPVLNPSN